MFGILQGNRPHLERRADLDLVSKVYKPLAFKRADPSDTSSNKISIGTFSILNNTITPK